MRRTTSGILSHKACFNKDTQSLIDQFSIDDAQIEALESFVAKSLVVSYVQRLERLVGEELHQTKSRYLRSIRVLDTGKASGAILLDYTDPVVKMVEEGASAFDEKSGFANSNKKHLKKDGSGWYLTIPFSIGTPDTVGESDPFSSIMPQAVYDVVKNKPTDIPTAGGSRSSGIGLSELPEQYQVPKTRAAVTVDNKTFKEYVNKSPIFQGVIKQHSNVTGQNTYSSFRRVSDKSDENSWINGGIIARNLTDKAMNELESNLQSELSLATDQALVILGFAP